MTELTRQSPAENAYILIIDQDSGYADRLRTLFESLQYRASSCYSIEDGIDSIKQDPPDILLIDRSLDNDGETINTFKKMNQLQDSIFVMLHNDDIDPATRPEHVHEFIKKDSPDLDFSARMKNLMDLKKMRLELQWAQVLLKKEKKLLTRYFSEEIVEQILKDETASSLSGRNQQVSILFFDIRNSTGIGEGLDPETFAEFLSEFFTDLMDLVYGNHGSVNKMLGDGIMATFGCPVPTDNDVLNCVKCAVQIRDQLQTFNDVRPDYLTEPIRGGIGISTGNVFAGNIGSVRRMEYTVLGDAVNTAARLESMTKAAGVDILIDGPTRNALGNLIKVKRVKTQKIRGKLEEVDIFYLEDVLI